MSKILVIANILFPPIDSGSKSCINSYCNLLKEEGHEVFYLYLGNASKENIKIAKDFWGEHLFYYKYSILLRIANLISRCLNHNIIFRRYNIGYSCPVWGARKYIRKIIQRNQFNYAIFNYVWLSPLFKSVGSIRKILFTHDCFSNKAERIHQGKYSLSPNQEGYALRKADIVLAIQEREAHAFEILAPNKPVYTVYMPIHYTYLPKANNKNILFLSGDSDLNRNGISRFIKNVFYPLVQTNKKINLIIGGGISHFISTTYNHSQIKAIGNIANLNDFYLMGDIAINPVYQGTGLKIKTLEAISFGKIVIVDPHSIDGLYNSNNAPVIIAENDIAFVDALKSVLNGNISIEKQKEACKEYIKEMNEFIHSQYRLIFK